MTKAAAKAGVCRHCHCTEEHACQVPQPEGGWIPCSWWNAEQTVCSNPSCILKELGVIDAEHACYIVLSVEIRQFGLPGFTRHLYSRAESRFALDYLTAIEVSNETFKTAALHRAKSQKKPAVPSAHDVKARRAHA